MNCAGIIARLQSSANPDNVAGMARFGTLHLKMHVRNVA